MSGVKINYLSKYFNQERIDFLDQLKDATELLIENKKVLYEDDDYCASMWKGKKFGLIAVDNKKNNERTIYLKDYNGEPAKDFKQSDFIDTKWIKIYKKEERLNHDSFCHEPKIFTYQIKPKEENNKDENKLSLLRFVQREDVDKLWKENLVGKDPTQQMDFAKKHGFDNMGSGFLELFSNRDYYQFLKDALLIKKPAYKTSQTLEYINVYLNYLRAESNVDLSLIDNDYKVMSKYAEIYKSVVPTWGAIFEEIKMAFTTNGINSLKIANDLGFRFPMWLENGKIIVNKNSYHLIIDFVDRDNYDVYVNNDENQNYIKLISSIKSNEIDKLKVVAISVRDKNVINAHPHNLYLLNLDMEYGYEMLLNMGLLEENPNRYSYDYMIRYHATLYGVSELNILYRAFAGLGTGIEYSVEHGAFYEKKMLNIDNLVDFVPATDAYESRVFVLQGDIDNLRGFKLDNLNKDWHNGLKKLISNYDKNKVEINDELKEVFSQIKDEKIIESKLKELPKIMNKLKKLNKQLDEREAKMLSVLKINNKNK